MGVAVPHPRSFWAYAATDVVLDHVPTNPPDGEHVVEVAVLPVAAAVAFLIASELRPTRSMPTPCVWPRR
jgi:hypothetical protein